jgi:hypothetical protein
VATAWRAPVELEGLEVVGYSDVGDRPPFKLALSVVGERWYLFTGHLWHRGWSVLDVTDPSAPELVSTIPGPANTWSAQVNVADGLLLGGLARIPPRWGGDQSAGHDEAALLVDVRDPTAPRELATIGLGGTGSHRNFWAGGRYAYLAANARDHAHYLLIVVDVEDRSAPREVGRFWLPGQGPGEARPTAEAGVSLHGPAYVVGDLAYLAYGGAGMVILDVADPTAPRLVSRWSPSPPFLGGLFGMGVHTVRPLVGRGLAVVNGEAHEERCREAMTFAGIVDVSDPERPWLVSMLPQPIPPEGLGYRSYCDKGGRFGPHNQHLAQGQPDLQDDPDTVHLTWFNAGLRIYDVADARAPREVARFVPADPLRRYGPLPETGLVTQSEDVLVDRRGIIYVTDKHQGVHLLRRTAGTPS